VHDVARVLDQLNVLLPPGLTVRGLAESVTVGAHCANAGDAAPLPKTAKTPASASGANRDVDFMAR